MTEEQQAKVCECLHGEEVTDVVFVSMHFYCSANIYDVRMINFKWCHQWLCTIILF